MKTLIVVNIILTAWQVVVGLAYLIKFVDQPSETIPKWIFGQFSLMCGVIGLVLNLVIFSLARKLTKPAPKQSQAEDDGTASVK
jgi:hypothetical protein